MKNVIDVIKKSMFVNLGLSFIKIVFGYIGHSRALIVDGIHSLSDLTTDLVVIFGSHFASKPADDKHPYGHGKAEYLLSLFVGVMVITLGINLIIGLKTGEIIVPNIIVIYISLFTIVVKLGLSEFVLLKAKAYKSDILKSSGKESRADVLTSVIVLISVILMQFDNEYLRLADSIASILIGLFVVKVGFDILKESVSSIIGEQVNDVKYKQKLEKIILANNIKEIKNMVILNYGHYYKLIIDVAMNESLSLKEAHAEVDNLELLLKESDERIAYITVHMSPYSS